MIQELRAYSKTIFFKILLGIIAITFVLSFGVGGFFGDRKEIVAKVNDSEILLKEYRELYQSRLRILQNQFGENVDQIAEQINLRQQVFDQLVDRYLLLGDAEELNIIVTDLEVQDFIKKQPFFQKNGQFDYNTYEAILNQNRIIRHEYENSLRKDILLTKKRQSLVSGVIINDKEVEQAYKMNFEKIELDYIFFDPQVFLKKTSVTEDQLKNYYHNNKGKFKTLNNFRIEYFTISSDFFKEKIKIKEREIRRYYKKNIENYMTPPEIKARHILLKLVPDAPEKTVLEKKEHLNNLLKKIKDGESFEEIAKINSEDATSKEGGDLGWFGTGEMVPSFEEAAFSLEVGQVSEIVRSPFGLHLIKVDDIKEKVTRSLENAREEIIVILKNLRSLKKLNEETDRLITIERNTFTDEAEKLKKVLIKTDWFDSLSVLPKLGSTSDLAKELIRKTSGQIGVWKRNPVMGHVFYRLNDIKKPQIKTFEESKNDVFIELQRQKAELIATETAKEYISKLEGGSSIEELIEKLNLKVENIELTANSQFIPKIGNKKEFLKVALKLDNKIKYGLSISENNSYILMFKNRSMENEDAKNVKKQIKSQLLKNMQQALLDKELKRLRESARIEVKNPMFTYRSSS